MDQCCHPARGGVTMLYRTGTVRHDGGCAREVRRRGVPGEGTPGLAMYPYTVPGQGTGLVLGLLSSDSTSTDLGLDLTISASISIYILVICRGPRTDRVEDQGLTESRTRTGPRRGQVWSETRSGMVRDEVRY